MEKKHSATESSADLRGLDAPQAWDTELAFAHLQALGEADTKRTAERRLNALELLPQELGPELLLDERDRSPNRLVLDWAIEQARKRRDRVLFAQISPLTTGQACLHANDARGARFWVPMANLNDQTHSTSFDGPSKTHRQAHRRVSARCACGAPAPHA